MKFWEAVEAARKTGCMIKVKAAGLQSAGCTAIWNDTLGLVWKIDGQRVPILDIYLDANCEIVPVPPKEYSFAEAYKMMKAGKWMKRADNQQNFGNRSVGGMWYCSGSPIIGVSGLSFTSSDYEARWIEVKGEPDASV